MSEPNRTSLPAASPIDERLRRLIEQALPGTKVVAARALGTDVSPGGLTSKGTGYGAPLRIEVEQDGRRRSLVLHTSTANPFGHDRRADRAAEALLAADTFESIPLHVRVLDVGAFGKHGQVLSLRDAGEFYLLTEWGEGQPYAEDLRRIARASELEADDRKRVDKLSAYLAALHANRVVASFARERALRDLLGSGEGIFGIVDAYPHDETGDLGRQLRRIEDRCLEWRWRLKGVERPLVRVHGDFHPFNVLFDAQGDLVLLDTSRGSLGDAADDVTCMALNFPFFALERPESWRACFSSLWSRFWNGYLTLSGDATVLDVAAPFLAWRGLVLANPVWYPALPPESRARLLDFVESVLSLKRFDPALADQMFA